MRASLLVSTAATLLLIAAPALALTGQALNRTGLTKTFGDEFTTFSWYAEIGKLGSPGGGTWRTNYGYTWVPLNDLKNHTLIWNKEEQIYVDPGFTGSSTKPLGLTALSVKNGILNITANRTTNKNLYGYKYTSGLITTEPTFTQTYGYFEMRAKLPKGRGLWPAFWLLPADKTWPPEIDAMELLGHDVTHYYTTLHHLENGVHKKSDIPAISIPDASAGFHTYGVEWTPTEIVFYFDDKEVSRRPTPPGMDKPFYMLINLGMGGDWAGSPTAQTKFPAVMQVDWVRAWRRDPVTAAAARAAATQTPTQTATTTTPVAQSNAAPVTSTTSRTNARTTVVTRATAGQQKR